MKTSTRAVCLTASGLLLCRSVFADNNGAVAEALFQDARSLLEQGNTKAACPKFAESQRLEPATGTLLGLALCHEQDGKLASAWAEFVDAEGQAGREGQKDRAEFARGKAAALKPRLSTLRIVLSAQAQTIPGLEVRRDGSTLGSGGYDVAIPIDGGEHSLSATAEGYEVWETRVTLASEKDVQEVTVPGLVRLPEAVDGKQPTPIGDTIGEPPQKTPARWSTLRWVGVGAAGAGVIALGVGGYFGWSALDAKDRSGCAAGGACPDTEGVQLWTQAQDDAGIATLALLSGTVLVGTGATLFFVGGNQPERGSAALTFVAAPGAYGAVACGTF